MAIGYGAAGMSLFPKNLNLQDSIYYLIFGYRILPCSFSQFLASISPWTIGNLFNSRKGALNAEGRPLSATVWNGMRQTYTF